MSKLDSFFLQQLQQRQQAGLLRTLKIVPPSLIDFSSNDYLGFAKNIEVSSEEGVVKGSGKEVFNGSTGSRLLTGNSPEAEELEAYLASFHKAPAARLFNSGYDANLGLFSAFRANNVRVVYDALVHASIADGIRLSGATTFRFPHNDLQTLEKRLLLPFDGPTLVVVESIYSMDGDFAPLPELVALCKRHSAQLFVDEAHATGIFGPQGEGRVVELGLHKEVEIRLHTFGKALGVHGAALIGSKQLCDWLTNFARPLIYSTALPGHSIQAIKAAYEKLGLLVGNRNKISDLIRFFKQKVEALGLREISSYEGPIQTVLVPGNAECKAASTQLFDAGFDVRPILSPTVPKGSERLRICLHAFNTEEEISSLLSHLKSLL